MRFTLDLETLNFQLDLVLLKKKHGLHHTVYAFYSFVPSLSRHTFYCFVLVPSFMTRNCTHTITTQY